MLHHFLAAASITNHHKSSQPSQMTMRCNFTPFTIDVQFHRFMERRRCRVTPTPREAGCWNPPLRQWWWWAKRFEHHQRPKKSNSNWSRNLSHLASRASWESEEAPGRSLDCQSPQHPQQIKTMEDGDSNSRCMGRLSVNSWFLQTKWGSEMI